jgi:hypothetical protein
LRERPLLPFLRIYFHKDIGEGKRSGNGTASEAAEKLMEECGNVEERRFSTA